MRVAAAALLFALSCAAQGVAINLEGGAFKVTGWAASASADWPPIFSIYAGAGDVPPVLGSYAVEDGTLVFRPRFPLAAGLRYRAVFQPPDGSAAVESVFEIPKPAAAASTRVEHVYPSTDVLPSNQLKLYIFFSAPMARGEAWKRIHLLDEDAKPVELPFLEVQQELWDRDYRRLTVLFDPGRIKRGLVPEKEVGPPLVEGKHYTLVIDREWMDARGEPLAQAFQKQFRVAAADREPIDPKQWKFAATPGAGSLGPVILQFPKPLDYALLLRLIEVPGVTGSVSVYKNETEWRFTPDSPWKPGDYQIHVDAALEDLAGNKVGRAFDVDTFDRVSEHLERKTVSLPFAIIPAVKR